MTCREIFIELENERKSLRKIGQICSFVIPLGAVGAVELVNLIKDVRPEYANIIGSKYIDYIIFNFGLGLALLTVSFMIYIIDDIHGITFPIQLYPWNRWGLFTVGIIAVFKTMIDSIALHFGGKFGTGHSMQIIFSISLILLFLVTLNRKKEEWLFSIPIFVYLIFQPIIYAVLV